MCNHKWTTKVPKVSGYYWLKEHIVGETGYFMPTIVKVIIKSEDYGDGDTFLTEEVEFISQDVSRDLLKVHGQWAGPIPPPK